jgi:hypothetical protein
MATQAKTPKKTAKAKTAATKHSKRHAAPAKKLSQIEAAVEVLKAAAEPMTCKQMVEVMLAKKLWASPAGRTPEATLYASILRELTTKGKDARFVKAAPGRFALKA